MEYYYLLIQGDLYLKIQGYGICIVNELVKNQVNRELLGHVEKTPKEMRAHKMPKRY